MGKAMFTIIGAMAELERNVIRERIVAGLVSLLHRCRINHARLATAGTFLNDNGVGLLVAAPRLRPRARSHRKHASEANQFRQSFPKGDAARTPEPLLTRSQPRRGLR